MKLGLRAAAGALSLLFGCSVFAQQDDSPQLNAGIRAAIDAGLPAYVIPPGTYRIANPLVIPAGTKNFALLGSGIGVTTIQASVDRSRLIEVGEAIMSHNNWGLTDKMNRRVQPVPEGSQYVRLEPGQPALAPGAYILWDENLIINRYGGGDTYNRAEIVRVLGYDPVSRVATLDQPVGRRFDVLPKLADFRTRITENIRVGNMTIRGRDPQGVTVGASEMLYASAVRGLTVQSIQFIDYANNAAMINVCKDTVATNLIIDRATQSGVGAGYGFNITRSRFSTVSFSQLNSSQALKAHSGSMDTNVEDCVSTAGGNCIDAHGFDELRMTVVRCSGNGGITLGNEAWAAGGKGHRVEDTHMGFLFIGPNATDVLVRRSSFREALSLSDLDPALCDARALPRGGRPGVLRFEDTGFTAPQNVINDFRWYNVESADFVRCVFITTNPSFGNVIKLTGARGYLGFNQCAFYEAANREAIELSNDGSNDFMFFMNQCTINSSVGLDVGVWLRPEFSGGYSISNNTLQSPGAPGNALFLKNESVAPGKAVNNRVDRQGWKGSRGR
jgi:hypothetical protein